MKYYLLNALDRLKQYSQKLDAEAIFYNKSWVIFNDTGNKEVFIFRPNNELIISQNGIVSKGKWEILPTSHILIDMADQSYMFNVPYISTELIALNLDGHNESMIMIEENCLQKNSLHNLQYINSFLDNILLLKNSRSQISLSDNVKEYTYRVDPEREKQFWEDFDNSPNPIYKLKRGNY